MLGQEGDLWKRLFALAADVAPVADLVLGHMFVHLRRQSESDLTHAALVQLFAFEFLRLGLEMNGQCVTVTVVRTLLCLLWVLDCSVAWFHLVLGVLLKGVYVVHMSKSVGEFLTG